jgi:hypothetical protein
MRAHRHRILRAAASSNPTLKRDCAKPLSSTLATMKIVATLLVIALAAPFAQASETLCNKGEVNFFSCQTKANGKVISICGNIENFEINDDSWLQYRFGKPRAVELVYPHEKNESISKFEGNNFSKYNVIDLRFINKKTLYSFSIAGPYNGEEANKRSRFSGGISVEVAKSKPVKIDCVNSTDVRKHYSQFARLNESLRYKKWRNRHFFHFYNHVPK